MKLRLLAVIVTLLALTYAPPGTLAEEQGEGGPATKDQDAATSAPSKTHAPSVEPADPDKVKHEGGKTDVDAVGNRNVGCKTGMGNWYGVEKQIAMGKQYAQQVEVERKADPGSGGHGIREPGWTEPGAQLRCPGAVHDQGDRLRLTSMPLPCRAAFSTSIPD